jgi:hypothetical protein
VKNAIANLKRLSRRAAASIHTLRPCFSQLCGRSRTARAAVAIALALLGSIACLSMILRLWVRVVIRSNFLCRVPAPAPALVPFVVCGTGFRPDSGADAASAATTVDGSVLPRLGDRLSNRDFCAATQPMKSSSRRFPPPWSIEERRGSWPIWRSCWSCCYPNPFRRYRSIHLRTGYNLFHWPSDAAQKSV